MQRLHTIYTRPDIVILSYGTAGSMVPRVLHFVRLRTCKRRLVADLFLETENVLSMLTFITKYQQNVNTSGDQTFFIISARISNMSDTSSITGSLKCLQNIPYSMSYMCKLLLCCRLVIYFQNEATWNFSLLFQEIAAQQNLMENFNVNYFCFIDI